MVDDEVDDEETSTSGTAAVRDESLKVCVVLNKGKGF